MIKNARFQRLSNDLLWESYCPICFEAGYQFTPLKWIGYDDDFWWNNVAPHRQIEECPTCHEKIKINFQTNEIEVLEGGNNADKKPE